MLLCSAKIYLHICKHKYIFAVQLFNWVCRNIHDTVVWFTLSRMSFHEFNFTSDLLGEGPVGPTEHFSGMACFCVCVHMCTPKVDTECVLSHSSPDNIMRQCLSSSMKLADSKHTPQRLFLICFVLGVVFLSFVCFPWVLEITSRSWCGGTRPVFCLALPVLGLQIWATTPPDFSVGMEDWIQAPTFPSGPPPTPIGLLAFEGLHRKLVYQPLSHLVACHIANTYNLLSVAGINTMTKGS